MWIVGVIENVRVEEIDDAVGIVLEKLDELNLADNTIVCFTSDNGGVSSGDAFSTSNLPLRGGKGRQPANCVVEFADDRQRPIDSGQEC